MTERRYPLLAVQTDGTMTAPAPADWRMRYGPWRIEHDPKPIPDRRHDWNFVHRDFDGPGDRRCGTGSSPDDCVEQIHEVEDDD